jgi:hypothetical protein
LTIIERTLAIVQKAGRKLRFFPGAAGGFSACFSVAAGGFSAGGEAGAGLCGGWDGAAGAALAEVAG